jgi:hypothetical protein
MTPFPVCMIVDAATAVATPLIIISPLDELLTSIVIYPLPGSILEECVPADMLFIEFPVF